jgi:hypothetical protein
VYVDQQGRQVCAKHINLCAPLTRRAPHPFQCFPRLIMNWLLDVLPDDPTTLKSAFFGLIALIVTIIGPLIWKHGRSRSQDELAAVRERLSHAKDEIAARDVALKDLQASTILTELRAREELHEETISRANEKISQLELEKEGIAGEKKAALTQAAELGHQTAELASQLARLDQDKAVVEARLQELQGFVLDANQLTDRLRSAALRSIVRAREEYESKKDQLHHTFVKKGDARDEVHEIVSQQQALQDSAPKVEFDADWDGGHTVISFVGHAWYERMRSLEGWMQLDPGPDDHVTFPLSQWADAYAAYRRNPENRLSMVMSFWWDCATISFVDESRTTHWLSVLATLRNGRLTPMANYVSGPGEVVGNAARQWVSQNRIKV